MIEKITYRFLLYNDIYFLIKIKKLQSLTGLNLVVVLDMQIIGKTGFEPATSS
ncbi:hypothetical protein HMPREF0083_01956, partial [Aneurinibacillus aneurinilyticus ATCC 12856]